MKEKLWELVNNYSKKIIYLGIKYVDLNYYSFLERQRIKTEIEFYQEIVNELTEILNGEENNGKKES